MTTTKTPTLAGRLRAALTNRAAAHLAETGGASGVVALAAQLRYLPWVGPAGRLALKVSQAAQRCERVASFAERLRRRRAARS